MRTLFLLVLGMAIQIVYGADAVKIGDLYYNLIEKGGVAEVTGSYGDPYTGEVVIPEYVTYNGQDYKVISISGSLEGFVSVVLPKTLESIGSDAFYSSLKDLYLTNSVPSVAGNIFLHLFVINIHFDNIEHWLSMAKQINPNYAPSRVHLFNGDAELTSVNIPSGATSVSDNAFRNCKNLTSITIPEGVAVIEKRAFYGCEQLVSLSLPSSLTTIMESAFEGCASLPSMTIPESVNEIGPRAFVGLKSITSITLPEGVTAISNSLFVNCFNLSSVEFPNSVTSIGSNVFKDCTSLESISLPDHLKTMESECFKGCVKLKRVVLPDGLTAISDGMFFGCSELSDVVIPASVTSIGNEAFYGCTQLGAVSLPEALKSIGNRAFKGCEGLTSIALPSDLSSMGYSAFLGSSLVQVDIPDKLTRILSDAFSGCQKLKSVTIGSGIKFIEERAFADCLALEEVICKPEQIRAEANTFEGSYTKYATLVVPPSGLEYYQATQPWSGFGKIVDNTTGIGRTYLTDDGRSTCYDLQGRRLMGKPEKGIYIQHGKKYVSK